MAKQLVRLALVILVVSISCNLPAVANPPLSPTAPPQAEALILVSAGRDATATPTPYQPIGPTITPTATATPTPTLLPTPTLEPTVEIPPQPTPFQIDETMPEGTFTFLVLGNDLRPGGGFRTDVIMLVVVNTSLRTVSVISFPRDLYVNIPGWMTQRINTAFQVGGFSMMADTFQSNFGIRPKFYVMTNFDGFMGIINGLGGIDVNVGKFLSDSCDLPQSRAGRCTVYPGTVSMDGATALWYVRSRHSTSDFDRTRRAQEVLYGLFNRLMSINTVARLPEIYNDYRGSVETNIGVDDIAPLLPMALQALSDSSRIRRYSVGPGQVWNYITPDGAMVLLPNYAAIQQMISEAISTP